MKQLFAVILRHGPDWQDPLPLEAQPGWSAHASFMDALVDDGFVVLGGPMQGTGEVLLVIRAGSEQEVAARLAADPWHVSGLLGVERILPWTIRLGSI